VYPSGVVVVTLREVGLLIAQVLADEIGLLVVRRIVGRDELMAPIVGLGERVGRLRQIERHDLCAYRRHRRLPVARNRVATAAGQAAIPTTTNALTKSALRERTRCLFERDQRTDDPPPFCRAKFSDEPGEELSASLVQARGSPTARSGQLDQHAPCVVGVGHPSHCARSLELIDEATHGALLQPKAIGELLLGKTPDVMQLADRVSFGDGHRHPARGRVGACEAKSSDEADEGSLHFFDVGLNGHSSNIQPSS
jgi:hypothetical protein